MSTTSDNTDRVWWYEAMKCEETSTSCHNQWKTIHIAALIPAALSSIASIFIIITGIKYHHKFSNLTFAARLPIFLSICDLFYEVFHGGDHLHNIIHDYVSEGDLCQLFGSMKPFWINCQTAWALSISIYLYFRISDPFKSTNEKSDTFGPGNIYLHLFCWGVPTIILIIGFIIDVYDVEGPWCGIPSTLPDFLMVDLWICLTVIIMVILYGIIIYKLHSMMIKSDNSAQIRRTKRVIRNIGLYPLAYVIQ